MKILHGKHGVATGPQLCQRGGVATRGTDACSGGVHPVGGQNTNTERQTGRQTRIGVKMNIQHYPLPYMLKVVSDNSSTATSGSGDGNMWVEHWFVGKCCG